MSFRVEKLSRAHQIDVFDCGNAALNTWLARFALANQLAHTATTYLALHEEETAGFYSLAVGDVDHATAPERLRKGLARHPIPIMLLARLAVDLRWQRQGVGRALMKDAVLRTLQAAAIAGIRALVVHAKDAQARAFYEQFDFAASPTDPLHLFILMKDLEKLARR
jgi:GNAT superfamily N-acetyltransferase